MSPQITPEFVQSLYETHSDSPAALNAAWFVATGQMPETPTPDSLQVGFYTGMQCEELAEKLSAILGDGAQIVQDLHAIGDMFKKGRLNDHVGIAMTDPKLIKKLLDGDVDLQWVTTGSMRAQGADGEGAWNEVAQANWRKRWADGVFHRDPGTGKVLKPEGWEEPDLTQFIHPDLQG